MCIEVEASLPEPAALLRPDLRLPEGHSSRRKLPHTFHTPTGDLVANGEETALQRYSAQPNSHLHGGIGVTKYKHFTKQNVTFL